MNILSKILNKELVTMEMLTLLNLTNQKCVSYLRLLIMLSLIIPKTFNFNVANVKCHIKIKKVDWNAKKNDVKKTKIIDFLKVIVNDKNMLLLNNWTNCVMVKMMSYCK
jgi:hypothetical protein